MFTISSPLGIGALAGVVTLSPHHAIQLTKGVIQYGAESKGETVSITGCSDNLNPEEEGPGHGPTLDITDAVEISITVFLLLQRQVNSLCCLDLVNPLILTPPQ